MLGPPSLIASKWHKRPLNFSTTNIFHLDTSIIPYSLRPLPWLGLGEVPKTQSPKEVVPLRWVPKSIFQVGVLEFVLVVARGMAFAIR